MNTVESTGDEQFALTDEQIAASITPVAPAAAKRTIKPDPNAAAKVLVDRAQALAAKSSVVVTAEPPPPPTLGPRTPRFTQPPAVPKVEVPVVKCGMSWMAVMEQYAIPVLLYTTGTLLAYFGFKLISRWLFGSTKEALLAAQRNTLETIIESAAPVAKSTTSKAIRESLNSLKASSMRT